MSIGATRCTEFGESGYLQKGDEVYTVLYPSEVYDENEIKNMINDGNLDAFPAFLATIYEIDFLPERKMSENKSIRYGDFLKEVSVNHVIYLSVLPNS